jgi:hypothetical protein
VPEKVCVPETKFKVPPVPLIVNPPPFTLPVNAVPAVFNILTVPVVVKAGMD